MRAFMKNIFRNFIKEEKGQTLVEWIMILALILIVVIGVLRSIGEKAGEKGKKIEEELG